MSKWDCEWGDQEDAKLVIGVWKYGHGNWEAMVKDPELKLETKFFLEDAKIKADDKEKRNIPNSIHLVRRADYLIGVLHDSQHNTSSRPKTSAPRPKMKKASNNDTSKASSSKPIKRRATPDYSSDSATGESDEESTYESMNEEDCKELLRPVKKELKRLREPEPALSKAESIAHAKATLAAIGARIEQCADIEKSTASKDRRRKHLCKLASLLCHFRNCFFFFSFRNDGLIFISFIRGLDRSFLPY